MDLGGYHKVTGTGFAYETPQLEELKDPGEGKHLWTMIVCYRVLDPAKLLASRDSQYFDMENLIEIAGPLCRKCEKAYTPGLEKEPCDGDIAEPVF